MGPRWFESVAEAERRARRRLPPDVYRALVAGSQRGLTLADNRRAFDEIGLVPRILDVPATQDLGRTLLGTPSALPVVLSPVGVQAVHPDGEVAVARAAAARGLIVGLSSFASQPVEEVVAAGAPVWFQVYWSGSRADLAARIERAERAGVAGLVVTLDWSFDVGRDWGSPFIPERLDARALARLAPGVLARLRWAWSFARAGGPPTLRVPNMARLGQAAPTFFAAYREWQETPPPTRDDLAWLRAAYPGPLLVKGVYRASDARVLADLGFSGVSVSNHGGNNLDGTPSPLRALGEVVDAVGERVEVFLDGGVRRGSDVAKALALGAHGVLVGRAYLYGLAAAGTAGVTNVVDLLASGLRATLRGLGHATIDELGPSDLRVPAGFAGVPRP